MRGMFGGDSARWNSACWAKRKSFDQLREIADADWLKIKPADVGYWPKTSTAMSALMSAIG
jgi:hypothetical protein